MVQAPDALTRSGDTLVSAFLDVLETLTVLQGVLVELSRLVVLGHVFRVLVVPMLCVKTPPTVASSVPARKASQEIHSEVAKILMNVHQEAYINAVQERNA